MSLASIARDIETIARAELAELGLRVVQEHAEFVDNEDDSISFQDARGRISAVSIQVGSYNPCWANTNLNIRGGELEPIDGTPYSCVTQLFGFAEFSGRTATARVGEIVKALRENPGFILGDDLAAGTLDDSRFKIILPKLLERYEGEMRLSRSEGAERINLVEMVGPGGDVLASAQLGMGDIFFGGYDGAEWKARRYVGLVGFNENFDGDFPVVRREPENNGPRP